MPNAYFTTLIPYVEHFYCLLNNSRFQLKRNPKKRQKEDQQKNHNEINTPTDLAQNT
jgi:hypothetical protein